jgi:beta-galactosidase GanA
LKISTADVAFDDDQHGKSITWDKHCFYVNGKAFPIISGEFHYWRVPDRERWRPILLQYKAAGLTAIRIYFHWGFHSPAEDVYKFDGNRDVEYLLTLCEELDIFVLAAPGPYICAETQGGGLPIWLLALRHIKPRHLQNTLYRRYDEQYSKYCTQWLENILPILARHQVTRNEKGCVLALQVENENIEYFMGVPLGLADDMRHLAKTCRDLGIFLLSRYFSAIFH